MAKKEPLDVKSFETADGDEFGDLLAASRIETGKDLKIGLLSTGFFEYWSMYPELKGQIEQDAKVVYERLSNKHDIVRTEMVDTINAADEAGRVFSGQKVDMVILAYRAYVQTHRAPSRGAVPFCGVFRFPLLALPRPPLSG